MSRIALCVMGVLAAGGAEAATLRPAGTLDRPVVLLSDLFDDAGPEAGRVLGPGPIPGGRIVVEAPQLAAIARQYGVDWRPSGATDRVVLDRPGRPLPRETAIAALRAALAGVGAPEESELELPGLTLPMLPTASEPQASIEELDYDGTSGRFTGTLAVMADGMPTQRERLSGRLIEIMEVAVPWHRLVAGAVLAADDFHAQRISAALVHGEVLRRPEQATGMAPRHSVPAGQPVAVADLARPLAVQKGARVTMELAAPGLAVLAQGTALEGGAEGERIRVVNPGSRAVVEAEIVGPDRVRVHPGSVPLLPAGASQVAAR